MPKKRQESRQRVFRSPPPASHGKILRLSAALLLVLFLMYRARDPAVWAWMFPPGQVGAPQAIDDGTDGSPAQNLSRPLPADLYADVTDNTMFRAGDRQAFFTTLDWLKSTPSQEINTASTGRVTYAQLLQQPEHYRGQLVTVSGTLRQVSTRRRRAVPMDSAPELASQVEQFGAGIERWHEFFLQPDDHRSEPILIYGLELPKGFPEAGRMRQPARVTGVFFKRLVYGAAKEPALAPLLLAKELELTGPTQQGAAESSIIELIVMSCVVAFLATTIFMFFFRRLTRRNRSAEQSAEAILARLESRRGQSRDA
ncbi:MAG: hypothetical protein MPJ50_00950 [Pirellulales bacterium]|nr:hypothetical protein [Pirellulales bacterium]